MVFHPLVSNIWAGTDQNGTFFDNNIGVHLECAIQAEMVVELELALIGRKQSRRFRHKSIICKKATKRVRKCAKVKGHVEFKIDKTQRKDR